MTVRSHWPVLLSMLLLAGCGGSPDDQGDLAQGNEAQAIKPGPMLGGIDLSKPLRLRASDGKGWTLDLAPGRILYRPAGRPPVPFYPVSPRLGVGEARYPTQTPDGETVAIVLRPEACGKGDAAAPLTATLTIGARSYAGCASPLPIEQIRYDLYNEAMSDAENAGG